MKRIYLSPFNLDSIIVYHQLKKQGIKVYGFFDSNSYIWNRAYDGIGIYPRCFLFDAKILIVSEREHIVNEIYRECISLGYGNEDINIKKNIEKNMQIEDVKIEELLLLFPKGNSFLQFQIEEILRFQKIKSLGIEEGIKNLNAQEIGERETYGDKVLLKQMEIIVTNRCTLKCKKCSAGIQHFDLPKDLNIDSIIRDFTRIVELVDWIDRVVIMGGEPFLYKNLGKLMDAIYKNPNTIKKIGSIKIITNGTLIPNNEILKKLNKYGAIVWISNYREHSMQICNLIDTFRKEEINYTVLPMKEWSNVIQLKKDRMVQTKECLQERRKNDCITRCRTLANGKFYLCSLLKTMDYIGVQPFDQLNYVDIYEENAKEKIINMLDLNAPLPNACSFCSGCSEEEWKKGGIRPAEQCIM